MRLLLAVFLFIAVIVSSAPAEEPGNKYQPLVTYIRIDGQVCIAHNAEQFVMLSDMIHLVNQLKRNKANGYIDDLKYRSQVSSMLSNARSLGVKVN